jgi:hypothetical protein
MVIVALMTSMILVAFYVDNTDPTDNEPDPFERELITVLIDSADDVDGYLEIADVRYGFNSENIETMRPDIFKPGAFSMFDVLVYVAEKANLRLEYHLNDTMNTYFIDSLNGTGNWWYMAWYSGGWPESNVYRMDHYHWKPGTTLQMYHPYSLFIGRAYKAFRLEVERRQTNNGSIVVPIVKIQGRGAYYEFTEVNVTPHNLRSDIFQNGTITAIDAIMSLGDLGLLTYQIQWYDSLGSASVVRNYWVEAINHHVASGTCGFVYESGDDDIGPGNHIHLPSDSRVLNSPEYVEWFWICL